MNQRLPTYIEIHKGDIVKLAGRRLENRVIFQVGEIRVVRDSDKQIVRMEVRALINGENAVFASIIVARVKVLSCLPVYILSASWKKLSPRSAWPRALVTRLI